jgi:hypothetical protein
LISAFGIVHKSHVGGKFVRAVDLNPQQRRGLKMSLDAKKKAASLKDQAIPGSVVPPKKVSRGSYHARVARKELGRVNYDLGRKR